MNFTIYFIRYNFFGHEFVWILAKNYVCQKVELKWISNLTLILTQIGDISSKWNHANILLTLLVVDFGISGASIKVTAATKLLLLLIGKRINIILPWFGKPLVLTRAGELLNSGSRNLTPNLVHGPHYLLETKCYSAFTGSNNIYKSLKSNSKG